MFYLSDISGSQSLYSAGLLQELRDAQLQVPGSEVQADPDADEVAQPFDPAEIEGSESPRAGRSAGGAAQSSSVATGMAGAGFVHSKRGHSGESEASQDQNSPRRRKPGRSSRVTAPRALKKVQQQEVKDTQDFKLQGPSVNPYQKMDQPVRKRERAIVASQIMSTPVITLAPEDSAGQGEALFREKRFRHIPVASSDGRLVGLLSDRDLYAVSDPGVPVASIMATPVLSARPYTEIRAIADVLFTERIGGMPIVDDQERLVGILTRSDILRTLVNQAPLELWV